MTQIVVGLSNKFFRIEESVHQKTAAANLPRQPAMEARVELALWHLGALHAAEPRPVVDPEVRNPRQQHLDDTTAQIVRNEEVRVDQMQLADECLQHLTLVLEDRDIGVLPVLDFLLQIERQWLLVEFSEQGERLESFLTRRSILVNLVLHNAGNESDLLGVMLRSCHLHGEGQGD